MYLHESYLRVLGQEDRIIRKQAIRCLLCLGRVQVPKEEDTFKEGGNSLLSLTCKIFHNLTPVLIPSLIYTPVSGVFWVLIKSAPAGFPWVPASKSLSPCCFVFYVSPTWKPRLSPILSWRMTCLLKCLSLSTPCVS